MNDEPYYKLTPPPPVTDRQLCMLANELSKLWPNVPYWDCLNMARHELDELAPVQHSLHLAHERIKELLDEREKIANLVHAIRCEMDEWKQILADKGYSLNKALNPKDGG